MDVTRCCVVGLALWLVVSGAARVEALQGAPGSTSKPDYQGTGVIVGLMDEKMSMPFIAASAALFKGLKPGDRVEFGLKATPDALLVISLGRVSAPRR